MNRFFRILGWSVGLSVLCFVVFIAFMWVREWRPAPIENLYSATETCDTLYVGDTLRIVSWNIGYAGLGDDMDFFYDGGTSMRTNEERTVENLNKIIEFLQQQVSVGKADIILLQEVDLDSHRSYNINEYDSLRVALSDYFCWLGYNYVSDFVPIPVDEPMGGVKSGVVTLSRWKPKSVTRYSYPGGFSFPIRLFNLKRCLLGAEFTVRDTTSSEESISTLYINNTHNTAYDTGDMRSGELSFLNNFLNGKRYSITMGDWNCNPPGYTPSRAAMDDKYFTVLPIDRSTFPEYMTFVYDPTTPSIRYGYESYKEGQTTTTLVDFALCGIGIEPLTFETIDLGFENSDHNPIVATFLIKPATIQISKRKYLHLKTR